MLEKFGNVLKKSFDKIASAVFIDKKLIDSIIKDLQRSLIEADVNIQLVLKISQELKKAASEEKIKGVEKKEHIIKLLNDKIIEILGGNKKELELKRKQNRIMLIGLYGTGKTTTIAKLALYYSKRGKKTAIVGLDVHRPAAPEQLEQLAKKHNLNCFVDKDEKNALKIWKNYEKKLDKYDVVLIDSAGRDVLDKELIQEIKDLNSEIKPSHTILVLAADIGQAAKNQASEFKKSCNIDGVIITRMDSTAKGGGALTACNETNAPVFFITNGEKIYDIETFNPQSFIYRLLGIGDLESLIEKVRSVTDEKKQKKIEKRLEEGKFTLLDLYDQLESMGNLGSFDKIANMIPGFGKAKEKLPENTIENQEQKMKKWKFAIQSMTKEEIENPEILEKQTSRISRIAKGSGISTGDVRALIKQYKVLKDFIKEGKNLDMSQGFSQKQMMKLAKKFGKKKFMKF